LASGDTAGLFNLMVWPGDALTLPAIPAKVVRAVALTGGPVTVKQDDEALEISLPAGDRHATDTIIALELDRPAGDIAPVDVPAAGPSLTTGRKATASNVYQGNAQYGADKAVDGNLDTRWASDSGIRSAWLEVDLGRLANQIPNAPFSPPGAYNRLQPHTPLSPNFGKIRRVLA